MNHEMIMTSQRQNVYSVLAAVFFWITGAGAGLYLSSSINTLSEGGFSLFVNKPVPYGVLACLVVIFGSMFTLGESGKPSRARRAVFNYRHSWISREIICCTLFIFSVLIDHFSSFLIIRIISIVSSLLFIICQAFVVYQSTAIPAWNSFRTFHLFVMSSLTSGFGLLLILHYNDKNIEKGTLYFGILFLLVVIFLIISFFRLNPKSEFGKATACFRSPLLLIVNLVIGALFPLSFLILIIAPIDIARIDAMRNIIILSCGISIFLGALCHKFCILNFTGYTNSLHFNVSKLNRAD